MEGQRQVVGYHHGVRVVAEFPCSDVCPDYTVAIIHYDVDPGEACKRVGGVVRLETVPVAIAVTEEPFCVPKVLVERNIKTEPGY